MRQSLALHVPAERPLFVRLNDETAEYVIDSHEPVRVEALVAVTPEIGHRGALHLAFEKLFASPFGNADVLSFTRRADAPPVVDALPQGRPGARQLVGAVSGSIAVGAAATALTLSLISAERYSSGAGASQVEMDGRNRQVHTLNVASIAFLAVAGAAGLTWGWTKLWPDTGVSVETSSNDKGEWRGTILNLRRAF
jgi:hypothetical protein